MNTSDISTKEPKPLQPGLPAVSYADIDSNFQHRKSYTSAFGFCLVTEECLLFLAHFFAGKKVLEVGSGSGWLAEQLAQRGIDIVAADWADYRLPPNDEGLGLQIKTVYRLDHHGDALDLLPGNFDVVLLVWPNLETPFLGEQVARAMKGGQFLVYEGESYGVWAGSNTFFDMLVDDFVPLKKPIRALNSTHRTFPGHDDKWLVLEKK